MSVWHDTMNVRVQCAKITTDQAIVIPTVAFVIQETTWPF
jgi:hypothetical protein